MAESSSNGAADLQISIGADTSSMDKASTNVLKQINKINRANDSLAKSTKVLEDKIKKLSASLGG